MTASDDVLVEVLPRSRRRALAMAALTLWLPPLVPLVFGMLRDCQHCLFYYLVSLPVVPGILTGALLQRKDGWFFVVVAAVPTVLLFAGLYAAGRELPRRFLYPLQGLVITLVLFESIGFASALRA